jgi:cytosine/adenosine deaminase-related metal-dependent hydrolase
MNEPVLQSHIARWVVPVEGATIENGCVVMRGEAIVGVGPRRIADGVVHDHGEAVLLPGLVNAHTHLEFSRLECPLGQRGNTFAEWVQKVVDFRMSPEFDPAAAIERGLAESVREGVTTIGDIATMAPLHLFDAPPVSASVTSFFELIALSADRANQQVDALDDFLARADGPNVCRGISPHAPYSVRPSLFEATVERSAKLRLPLEFHLAESPEELRLLADGDGPMVDFLIGFGVWDPTAIPRGLRPLDYLKSLVRADRALAIHCNYLADDEIEFFATHAERLSAVYCPRTHYFFGHATHPLPRLLAAGANVALGTDGRCSNPDLSLLNEMRFVRQNYPQLTAAEVLKLGTINGARALGVDHEVGSLAVGKRADLIVVAIPNRDSDVADAVLSQDSAVRRVVHRGRTVASAAD